MKQNFYATYSQSNLRGTDDNPKDTGKQRTLSQFWYSMTNDKNITRHKSPSRLIRDKALETWTTTQQTSSPKAKKYPNYLGQTLSAAANCSRNRIYRWLAEPDINPLDWNELTSIAEELGGSLRCMFSIKHT